MVLLGWIVEPEKGRVLRFTFSHDIHIPNLVGSRGGGEEGVRGQHVYKALRSLHFVNNVKYNSQVKKFIRSSRRERESFKVNISSAQSEERWSTGNLRVRCTILLGLRGGGGEGLMFLCGF